jgi:hypothetical protein
MSIWNRSFWKSLWFALLRSNKDKRARSLLLGFGALVVLVGAEAWLIFVLPFRDGQGAFQIVFNGFVLATGIVAWLLLRSANRKQDEFLNFSLTGRDPQQLPEETSPDVRGPWRSVPE